MINAFISDNTQVAEILENVIKDLSCSDSITIRQATFSISEEFLRRIWRIKTSVNARFILVIDRKALQKTKSLWRFIANVYDEVYLADSHAKILLVESVANGVVKDRVSVITSQNLTRGNRHESTVITKFPDVYASLVKDFIQLTTKKSVPMHDILPVSNPDNVKKIQDSSSEEELSVTELIEEYAAVFLSISDIAVILDLDPAWLKDRISDYNTPESHAYRKGKIKAKAQIKAQEMQLARLGSPLGVQNVRDNLLEMEEDESF